KSEARSIDVINNLTQRAAHLEAAEDTALVQHRAVAGETAVVLENIDGLNPQRLRAACPAADPGPARQPHLIAQVRWSDRTRNAAVAETAVSRHVVAFRTPAPAAGRSLCRTRNHRAEQRGGNQCVARSGMHPGSSSSSEDRNIVAESERLSRSSRTR